MYCAAMSRNLWTDLFATRYPLPWQMSDAEKFVLITMLEHLQPDVAIEIGTARPRNASEHVSGSGHARENQVPASIACAPWWSGFSINICRATAQASSIRPARLKL
jgi:hypothetical protein